MARYPFLCAADQPDLLRYSRCGSRKPGGREIPASLIANWTADPRKRIWQRRLPGVAYPIRAEIRGRGVGAVRHCVFSTGPFVEPITTWDEPRLLQFDVTEQPRAMEEWSLYNDLRPPHVENYFIARKGQFALKSLPDGMTLLEGTTWYQNRFWPAPYWHWWSDYIIEGIHSRVLSHIKSLAENTSK